MEMGDSHRCEIRISASFWPTLDLLHIQQALNLAVMPRVSWCHKARQRSVEKVCRRLRGSDVFVAMLTVFVVDVAA